MAHAMNHPGGYLAKRLQLLGMSAAELSRRLRVPTNRITAILNGQRSITGDTALRLGHFFGTRAEFWLRLQADHDLEMAKRKAGNEIARLDTLKTCEARMVQPGAAELQVHKNNRGEKAQ